MYSLFNFCFCLCFKLFSLFYLLGMVGFPERKKQKTKQLINYIVSHREIQRFAKPQLKKQNKTHLIQIYVCSLV